MSLQVFVSHEDIPVVLTRLRGYNNEFAIYKQVLQEKTWRELTTAVITGTNYRLVLADVKVLPVIFTAQNHILKIEQSPFWSGELSPNSALEYLFTILNILHPWHEQEHVLYSPLKITAKRYYNTDCVDIGVEFDNETSTGFRYVDADGSVSRKLLEFLSDPHGGKQFTPEGVWRKTSFVRYADHIIVMENDTVSVNFGPEDVKILVASLKEMLACR